jgi:small subunit ribosomal protein S4
MARYHGPVCRQCRREGTKLFLKGDRCFTDKCAIERRNYPPGQHGQGRPRFSDYGVQLREKQKVRRMYGLVEKQFARTMASATRLRGPTGENLLSLLERRLDNVIFRLGFATSRAEARQLVRHGHFLVNGKRASIPSMLLKPGAKITVREKSTKMTRIAGALEALEGRSVPQWLEMDKDAFEGTVKAMPAREDITLPIQEQLIVELYSGSR